MHQSQVEQSLGSLLPPCARDIQRRLWDTWFPNVSVNSREGGRYDVSANTYYVAGVGGNSGSAGSGGGGSDACFGPVQITFHNADNAVLLYA